MLIFNWTQLLFYLTKLLLCYLPHSHPLSPPLAYERSGLSIKPEVSVNGSIMCGLLWWRGNAGFQASRECIPLWWEETQRSFVKKMRRKEARREYYLKGHIIPERCFYESSISKVDLTFYTCLVIKCPYAINCQEKKSLFFLCWTWGLLSFPAATSEMCACAFQNKKCIHL